MAPPPDGREVLLGADGCVPGEATPVQTVIHLGGTSRDQVTLKMHPAGSEKDTLLGWALCQGARRHPLRHEWDTSGDDP